MGPKDTPPASPSHPNDFSNRYVSKGQCDFHFVMIVENCSMEAGDDDAEIDAEDIVEVIDLDEGDGEGEPLDEDDEDDDGVVEGSSATHLSPAREDNSERDWEDHGGSKLQRG